MAHRHEVRWTGIGRRPGANGLAIVAAATLVVAGGLALGGCRIRRPGDVAVRPAPQGESDGLAPARGRPGLPRRGPGLASLPVFPDPGTPLAVAHVQPEDGAKGVAAGDRTDIVVQFGHPMVPLVPAGEQSDLPSPIELEPRVEGEGRWLNTYTYAFRPSGLASATRYTLRIVDGVRDVLDRGVEGDREFAFTTAGPTVVETYPADRAVDAGATRPVSVTFDQPMDRSSVEEAFALRMDGADRAVPGSFAWHDRTVEFRPARPLERGAGYVATIASSARAAAGAAALATTERWAFQVAPRPRIVATRPGDGDRGSTAMRGDGLHIEFNTPIDTSSLTVTVQPTITAMSIGWDGEDRTATVSGGWLASRAYTVTVPAGTRSRDGDPIDEDRVVRFSLAPLEPSVTLRTPGRFVMYPGGSPQVLYLDAVNHAGTSLELHDLPLADLLRLTVGENPWDAWSTYRPASDGLRRSWSVSTAAPVDAVRRVSTTLAASAGASLSPGLYLVSRVDSDTDDRYVAVVSPVNLTLKSAADEVLVWATDVATGRPMAGLGIEVFSSVGSPIAAGRTDASGLVRMRHRRLSEPWRPVLAVASDASGTIGAVGSDWTAGIDPWAFNFPLDLDGRAHYATVYTDRPVYRAGQTVYYRGVVRADDDGTYHLPDATPVSVTVLDSNYEPVQELDLVPGEFGTIAGEVRLSETARLGEYQVQLSYGRGDGSRWLASQAFRVSAYRKPEYSIDVTTDRPEYLQGAEIDAAAAAAYYFGGAVSGADVRWRLLRDDFFFHPPVEGWWSWIDDDVTRDRYGDAQGEVVSEGEGATDDDGRFALALPADVSDAPLAQVFTLDVEITDEAGRAVSGRVSAVVHKADLYLGLRPSSYVSAAGSPLGFDVLAVDAAGLPQADREARLALYRRTWYSVREQAEGGDMRWTSHFTDTLVAEKAVTTDKKGAAAATFTPPTAGVYRLVARGADDGGRQAVSAAYAWVSGPGYVNWRQENHDRIELVADRKLYEPGQTAEILVPAPFAPSAALLTVERGRVREARLVDLDGHSGTIRLPIDSDDAPNVYVSVVLVRGSGSGGRPQIKLGYTNLAVSTNERKLDVAIAPSREGPYGPRETAIYDVRATDFTGRPVRAELSVSLVDKALLALADDTSMPLEDAFYGQRPLGVRTSASLTASSERLNEELESERKGGGGGLTDEGTVRRLFRDTAFWSADVRTDGDGRARVSVELPDNLTTWQVDARAVTGDDTLVGGARAETLTTKELLVRPVLPRFVVVGDSLQLEAVVHNSSPRDLEVRVSLVAAGLAVDGPGEQEVRVPAGGKAKAVWQVSVPDGPLAPTTVPDASGAAGVRMAAVGGGLEDAVELSLPVFRFGGSEVVSTSGEITGASVTELLALPPDAVADRGGMSLEVASSLASTGLAGLHWLTSYPYDCHEQAASKFIPGIALLRVLSGTPGRTELESAVRQNVERGLQLLYAGQNDDGGWGWWSDGETMPWITAWVLFGMDAAADEGFAVSQGVRERAAEYLSAWMDGPVDAEARSDVDERAFVAHVLAEGGWSPPSTAIALYDHRTALGLEGRAFLALALAAGAGRTDPRVAALVSDLGSAATASATEAFWHESARREGMPGGDERTTAVALYALARLAPDHPHVGPAVRWLVASRSERHWRSTQDSAWAILALAERMHATGELRSDVTADVELDGEMLAHDVRLTGTTAPLTVTAPASAVSGPDPSRLVIRRRGDGRLYYSADLRAYRQADSLPPLDRGIVIGRQYFAVDQGTLEPTGEAIDTARLGDLVQVRLTVVAPTALHYVMVEDRLPAGLEVVDTSLKTTTAAAAGPEVEAVSGENGGEVLWWQRTWWSYWLDWQLRDDRVALFSEELPPGTYEYSYLLRAGLVGHFLTMPAHAEQMYAPDVFGRSAGGTFTVEPAR